MADLSPKRYGKDYYQQEFGLDELQRFNMHWWSVRFYARLADRLLRRHGGRRVLEIGCAHGYTLARLEARHETWGIDLSDYAIGRARTIAPRSRVFCADFTADLPPQIEAGGFDLIIAKYVLEHLADPEKALHRAFSLLAPGGRLLYSVPNMDSPGRRFKGRKWYAFGDETHVSLLERHEWIELTRRTGFEIERTFSDGLWDMPYLEWMPTALQYPIFCLPTVVTVFFARPMLPSRWGENLIVVARRPAEKASSAQGPDDSAVAALRSRDS
ncbi:MAG: class I SAM-dependent methyltransferase [Acidobacteriota bacterium]|nr:class I SAM-dependent methyltransferase [Acidobacteriota bacterium]MDQ7086667.1 class I SAM-dependent methyltransferase [Acidobacteriota bacterium]